MKFIWFLLFSMLLLGHARKLESDDDKLELTDMDARAFLKLQQQMNQEDCVLCKFNMIPCCKPNLCIKKRLQPDECLELRPR